MNRQPPPFSAGEHEAAAAAAAAAVPPGASTGGVPSTSTRTLADIHGAHSGSRTSTTTKKKKKLKRLRPKKHASRWSEALFGGGAAAQATRSSQLDSIEEGFEGQESSSSSRCSGSGSDDTVHRSGHSKQGRSDDCVDTGDSSAAEAGAETSLETSARSLDYISAAKPPQSQSAAPTANQASNATLQTAASTTCHEQSQSTLSGVPHRGGGGGGGNRRSSNSSGSGADGPAGEGDGRNTGTTSTSRLHSIPDDIEVSENPALQARSSSVPLIDDDDDLDIDNNIMQAANNNVSTGAGTHATTLMSAGLIPPVAGTLLAGRLNDSANSLGLGGGRAMQRTSDACDASDAESESIAASSIAAASWMGSMGDSDMSGSSSDCEGDGPDRRRLRTRRRRKQRGISNGSCDDGSAPAIVVEGAASLQSGRRRRRRQTSWRRNHLTDSAPAGVTATHRDRRSSDPICSHEVARAIADMEAEVSDLNSDSSSDDGNGYEKAPGSRLDAIVASLRAATANNGNAQRNTANHARDLNDLFRPNRVLRSTAPREPNSLATNSAAFNSSWPNRASASIPALGDHISHAAATAASPSVEAIGISAASAASDTAGTGIRRQDESFANVEDLIRSSLRTQPSSASLISQQGGAIHDNERFAQSWPIESSHNDNIASAAAVGVAVGARSSNNRSDSIMDTLQRNNRSDSNSIIDTLQNLDLRQHLRDHDSVSTFNSIGVDEAGTNDTTTTTTATGSGAGGGSLPTNPLLAERQAILGFGQERNRPGDSGHRISNSRPGPNSSRSGINSGPIRGIDALGAAIGAIAAAAPHRPPSSTTAGAAEITTTTTGRTPPAATTAATAPTANVRTRRSGPTRLYEAVASGSSYDTIKSLIDLDPSSTGHQNGAGLTPLHTAIERYDVPMSIIRLLLASNPPTASMPNTDGRTPLDLLWKRYVDPDSFRIQSSIVAANQLATLMEMAVSDDGCNRPPSSQSGSEEDVDVEENSGKQSGLSKRDMDRKARAMRILLSSTRLRDFWDLMTLFIRAAHHGTIADPLPSDHGRWRIVHSCVVTRCEPLLIRFAAALYPEQLRERDERTGRLPLHITSALSCERSANSIDKTVLRLWPRGAWGHDNEGRLAINLAIESGKPWRFVRALLLCAPPSLLTRDTKTQMMPFMIASASPHASLDCSYRLLRDSVDIMTNLCGDDCGGVTTKIPAYR